MKKNRSIFSSCLGMALLCLFSHAGQALECPKMSYEVIRLHKEPTALINGRLMMLNSSEDKKALPLIRGMGSDGAKIPLVDSDAQAKTCTYEYKGVLSTKKYRFTLRDVTDNPPSAAVPEQQELKKEEVESMAALLGYDLSTEADQRCSAINSAYRKSSLKAHPDRGGSEEAFNALTKAKNALKTHYGCE